MQVLFFLPVLIGLLKRKNYSDSMFALQPLLKRDPFAKRHMHCYSYDIKIVKHSLMGFYINQKLKNAKHLESANIYL